MTTQYIEQKAGDLTGIVIDRGNSWKTTVTVNKVLTGYTIASDAWSTSYFAASGSAMAAGCTSFPSFGIEPDSAKNARHSYIYQFRGGAASTLDLFDIAGGTTGAWTAAIVYDGAMTLTTGACGKYAPTCTGNQGRFGYLTSYTASAINQMYRFDVKNRVLSPETPTDWIQSGTAAVGDRMATFAAIDGTDIYTVVFLSPAP